MALTGNELRERAAPFLRALSEKTGLTSHMAILEHQEAVVVAKCDPLHRISQLATWLGKRMDVHCTSLGKALIAYLPEADIERIISEHGLPRHNENSLCSRRKLKEDLDRVVRKGYAVDDEEDELGLRCIGAPILTGQRLAIASISISGTIAQIADSNLPVLAALVVGTARSIETSLAYSSSDLF
jgi:DNA-binding IclR family transcriptional regulator